MRGMRGVGMEVVIYLSAKGGRDNGESCGYEESRMSDAGELRHT